MKKIPFLAAVCLLFLFPVITYAQAAPTITSISPTAVSAESSATTLTVNGTNFVSGATVRIGTTNLSTTFVSATRLTAVIPSANLETPGTRSITVANPDGAISNSRTFTVTTLPDTGFGPDDETNRFAPSISLLLGSGLALSLLLFAAVQLKSEK